LIRLIHAIHTYPQKRVERKFSCRSLTLGTSADEMAANFDEGAKM